MKTSHTFTPPPSVAAMAAKGLELRRTFKRGGTMVGVARARDLKNRRPVSERTITRMFLYFSRHMVDKRSAYFGNEAKPSKGYIAWLLWGGDPGMAWSYEIYRKLKQQNRSVR